MKRRNRISSTSSSSVTRKPGKNAHAGRLVGGLALVSIFAVIFYSYLLARLQSTTSDKDADINPLPWDQQDGGKQTTVLNKTNQIKNISQPGKNQDKDQHAKGKPIQKADVQKADVQVKIPSAKSLLTSKPPFEDSDVIKLYSDADDSKTQSLIKSPNTVVTGYFRARSKYHAEKYDDWMRNMLSLQDAMVIFTEPDLIDQIKDLRSHAVNRTVIIPVALDDLPIGKLFSASFWQDQLDRDPEKRIHRSYELFWIWLSKSWCVAQAIRMNVYDSDLFVWSDIGSFRERKYNSKTIVMHRENVPPHEMLQMAHKKPNPPKEELFNDKYKHKSNFYHSGSQFVGYKDTWLTFHEYFLETIDRFLENNMIIVEDQAVLQSVCLSHPEICAYAPYSQVKDNNYFGLRHILHFGGKYEYWRYHPETKN